MARNEEKQLARLNRYYLEKQKQEELKKRPPRPRLDTLSTPRELRKWLPTITRDIEFYVKQMEVTCYMDSKIAEFQDRIQRLKQEYGAYLRKLRTLEPDLNAASWADRPYAHRKRPHSNSTVQQEGKDANEEAVANKSSSHRDGRFHDFVPIPTPVLQNMPGLMNLYSLEKPAPVVWNVNPETEDQPLQFAPPCEPVCGGNRTAVQLTSRTVCKGRTSDDCVGGRIHPENNGSSPVCENDQSQDCASLDVIDKESSGRLVCSNPLNLDYSDSSDEDV